MGIDILHYFTRMLCDVTDSPVSALSSRPLQSADRLDLLVPRTRTALALHHAFASMGPSLWNGLPQQYTVRS